MSANNFDTAKSLMRTDFIAIKAESTVDDVLQFLRGKDLSSYASSYLYVVNGENHPVGVVALPDLVSASPGEKISSIMEKKIISVRQDTDQEEVAEIIQDEDLIIIPVVDFEGRLIGIIGVDDILDVIEAEVTEDFLQMAVVGKAPINPATASPLYLYRRRISWLLILVIVNIFAGGGMAYFEDTIKAVIALVFFLPLLIDSAGNAGSQSATLMIRALATGEVEIDDWLDLFKKEIFVAVLLGVTMGAAVSILGIFRGGPDVAVIVALSMITIVLVGSIIGMSLPFILDKFKLDPATASAPLITSIADITGILIYFSIASWYLNL